MKDNIKTGFGVSRTQDVPFKKKNYYTNLI